MGLPKETPGVIKPQHPHFEPYPERRCAPHSSPAQCAGGFAEQGCNRCDLGNNRLTVFLGCFTGQFDWSAAVIGQVEVMEVAEGDIDFYRRLFFYVDVENPGFVEVFREAKPSLGGDLIAGLPDPALEGALLIGFER